MAITTGGTVTLTAGNLPSNFCHTSWQSTLNNFVTATSVSFNGGALFTAGSSTPSASDENKLWCKMDSNNTDVLGWYYHDGDSWEVVPVPVASALPTSGATAGTYGDADNHVTMTVDTYGRVTAVADTVPTSTASDGLAKAWAKFQGSTGNVINSYNCSVNRSGSGQYTVTTSGVTFTSSPIVICSHTGFDHGTTSSESFTVSPAVRVTTAMASSNGVATIKVERAEYDGEDSADGDANWDAAFSDTDVCVVFFGN